MVRLINDKEIPIVSNMLKDMSKELWSDLASDNYLLYERYIRSILFTNKTRIYVDDLYRGFFIVRDETVEYIPNRKIVNGQAVYIKPEHRYKNILNEFYDKLFEDYKDYEIWGLTEYDSEHNKVLLKRHIPVAIVYKLQRSK